MIQCLPESNKPGNTRPVEKAKGQYEVMPETVMPETIMPVEVKPGKIIARQEQRMMRRKCLRQGTGRQEPRYRNVMMKVIQELKELQPTGTLWGNA